MRQLLMVLALVALGVALATRLSPVGEILPPDFSESFPAHREHHEKLLHNLGQRPLSAYPGDVVRLWWVAPNPLQLMVVEPDSIQLVNYTTAGYTSRVTSHSTTRHALEPGAWERLRKLLMQPAMWEMTRDPGSGPFSLNGSTWILEMKLGQRYRCLEKIDPKPELFTQVCRTIRGL